MAVSFLDTVSVTPRTGQGNVLAQLDWWVGVGRKIETTAERKKNTADYLFFFCKWPHTKKNNKPQFQINYF